MKRFNNQRGDTLIEITIALAILSSVLLSAYVVANRAYLVGLTASERARQASLGQRQAELLTFFRDSHTWAQFLDGVKGAAPPGYEGINTRKPNHCNFDKATGKYTSQCFHMETKNGILQPQTGPYALRDANLQKIGGELNNSFVDIRVAASSTPDSIDFIILYGTDAVGDTSANNALRNKSHVYLTLSNVDGLRSP